MFVAAAKQLGLPDMSPGDLYRVRHGGASWDVATEVRSLTAVKRRGVWKSDKSVGRYAKPMRLTEQLTSLDPVVLKKILALADGCTDAFYAQFGVR